MYGVFIHVTANGSIHVDMTEKALIAACAVMHELCNN